MPLFDDRIVTVGIEVNGRVKMYTGLAITASGTKYANANQNECEIKITNLDKATRDFISTETTPFNPNRTPKRVSVDAGRVSYGTSRIYFGDVMSVSISQPPDIELTLKCLTGYFQNGNIIARNQTAQAPISKIATQIASDLGVALNFQAIEQRISNYSFSGAAVKQIDKLNELVGVNAYLDDGALVVKNSNVALRNRIKIINLNSGMVGIPELTEFGVKVKYLLDTHTVLGGTLRVQSMLNPGANGDYIIYKLGFEIASRDKPFYYTAEAKRL